MLDSDTKRRIDSCRDILVGKVPDPKSQVEQITIALIYKFMDDMDAEAEELGGKRTFFAGEYEKYGWSRLMAPNMGGFDVLALYSEAIQKMNENPGIPALFRDIFKNAYLPYRDPETLRSFLKEIDGFTYDHSEKLGDAFEYLLSVLGSQGDAGQFRTPRHIIDFMVEIIAPKKGESILDPACGTAGFLISAWKHILKNNTKTRSGDLLTPDERKRLAANIHGYDISPDMVRLSLVNMYLHGFTDPHIVEYDTLTSEEKWNEYADIILANPPFMSPKGGIKPHKRFSVQATRSEVLFVDYMAEHLTPNGRAAIIVPEGVIFQSGSAYKQLREMLVKTSLVAVVSLPAGVFNPYSGVKTSILFLDKRLAKMRGTVLFAKVENDGFNLGAQRRAVDKNDLPGIESVLKTWLAHDQHEQNPNLLLVEKERICENDEWTLNMERYQDRALFKTQYKLYPISEIVRTITPPTKLQKTQFGEQGRYPIIDQSQQNIAGWTDDETALVHSSKPLVIFGDHTCAIKLINGPFVQGADGIKILETIDSVLPSYLYNFLRTFPLESDGYKRHYTELKLKSIPVPPLAVQQEIVEEINGHQKIIDGARQVVENYQPHIAINSDWPVVELEQLCEVTSSKRIFQEEYVDSGIPFYRTKEIVELSKGHQISLELFISSERFNEIIEKFGAPKQGDILVSAVGTIGVSWVVSDEREFYFKDGNLLWLRQPKNIDSRFLKLCLDDFFSKSLHTIIAGAAYNALTIVKLKQVKIPVPDLATQLAIVAQIEEEQHHINSSKELIRIFGQKIMTTINSVCGDSV